MLLLQSSQSSWQIKRKSRSSQTEEVGTLEADWERLFTEWVAGLVLRFSANTAISQAVRYFPKWVKSCEQNKKFSLDENEAAAIGDDDEEEERAG